MLLLCFYLEFILLIFPKGCWPLWTLMTLMRKIPVRFYVRYPTRLIASSSVHLPVHGSPYSLSLLRLFSSILPHSSPDPFTFRHRKEILP